ncbi:hypothetical protein NADE_003007 [Nannochloris sp. 'desiccata']|nr:hypothetical protein KSW81_000936 [Chlorella desiccata (nom. nud.)]KAH7620383.1 hypothetical protein NADE_003007 [Chlorella desiccata (nom. nud.)]
MSSPPLPKKPGMTGGGFFENIFRIRRRQYSEDGSSRRGRRYWDRGEDCSVGKDSSTHSALFDLELSTRGARPLVIEERVAVATAAGTTATVQDGALAHELHAKLRRVAYLARPVAIFEVELLQDVQALREHCSRADGEVELMRMAQELCRLGYICSLQCNDPAAFSDSLSNNNTAGTTSGNRTANNNASTSTGVVDSTCLERLHHSFIICTGRSDGTVAHYCLVDPHFRDQFRIGQPTKSYESALNAMPPEFVGSPLRLQALADLLCTEIVEVYREQKLPLPPWRKSEAMLSKWFDVSAHAKAPRPLPPTMITHLAPAPIATASHTGAEFVDDTGALNANNLARARSGGWSDLATIQETPSPHYTMGPPSVLAGSSLDLYGGSVGAQSAGGSSDGGGRQKSGKVVSLLARGLSGLGLSGSKNKNAQLQHPMQQGVGRPPQRSLSASALEQRQYQEQQQRRK